MDVTSRNSVENSSITIPLSVGVIGCGRMGRLHARVYSQMPQVKLVGVYDVTPESAREIADEFNCRPFTDLDDLLANVAAVSIAVPTHFHGTIAEPCLKRGIAC